MYKILTLNNISVEGLQRLPRGRYEVASEIANPDAILVRSFKMHDMEIPSSLQAVGRAGAGVNNIPCDALADQGIPVFNAPGANANAVKELVIGGMLMAVRNLAQAWAYTRDLTGTDAELSKAVEAGKKTYVGTELPGKTLGVIGLGAIGVQVANTARALGMEVVGFDPAITVERAWELSSGVRQARSLDDLCARSDVISLHVPLLDATRGLLNAERIAMMKSNGIIVNMARGEIVDEAACLASLDAGHLGCYVSDFPTSAQIAHEKVITLPHLGASTHEAESNCAVMVADNVKNYLENGIVRYSVNFPEADMPRTDAYRITVANRNVPNMVGQISTCLGDAGLNIEDLLNKSRGELAYTIIDVDAEVSEECLASLRAIDGVLNVRSLGKPIED